MHLQSGTLCKWLSDWNKIESTLLVRKKKLCLFFFCLFIILIKDLNGLTKGYNRSTFPSLGTDPLGEAVRVDYPVSCWIYKWVMKCSRQWGIHFSKWFKKKRGKCHPPLWLFITIDTYKSINISIYHLNLSTCLSICLFLNLPTLSVYLRTCLLVCLSSCVCESRSVESNSLRPQGLYTPWDSPGQDTGVGCLSLLQSIFPTQGSNLGLPYCRQVVYQLSHQGNPLSIYLPTYLPIYLLPTYLSAYEDTYLPCLSVYPPTYLSV